MLLDQFPFPVTTLMAKGVSLNAALTDLQHFRDEFNEALSAPRECGVAARTDRIGLKICPRLVNWCPFGDAL